MIEERPTQGRSRTLRNTKEPKLGKPKPKLRNLASTAEAEAIQPGRAEAEAIRLKLEAEKLRFGLQKARNDENEKAAITEMVVDKVA